MNEPSLNVATAELLNAVGTALSSWSVVELQMMNLFRAIADMRSNDKPAALFEGIISFEIRLSIIDRLMRYEEADEVEMEMWFRLSARLSKLYKKRHEVAHFTVVGGPPFAIAPFLNMTDYSRGVHRTLSLEQITERATKFGETARAVSWFHHQAFKRRWPPEGDQLPPIVEPAIVPLLRNLAIQNLEAKKHLPQSSRL